MGIEPTSSAWEAEVLPLNYTRDRQMLSMHVSANLASTGDSDGIFEQDFVNCRKTPYLTFESLKIIRNRFRQVGIPVKSISARP